MRVCFLASDRCRHHLSKINLFIEKQCLYNVEIIINHIFGVKWLPIFTFIDKNHDKIFLHASVWYLG